MDPWAVPAVAAIALWLAYRTWELVQWVRGVRDAVRPLRGDKFAGALTIGAALLLLWLFLSRP